MTSSLNLFLSNDPKQGVHLLIYPMIAPLKMQTILANERCICFPFFTMLH